MADRALQGVLRWERPPDVHAPATRQPPRPWAYVAAQLREKPGHWGVIDEDCGTNGSSIVNRINTGFSTWWQPVGSFLAVQRTVAGRITVFAVYLGADHEYASIAGVKSLRAA